MATILGLFFLLNVAECSPTPRRGYDAELAEAEYWESRMPEEVDEKILEENEQLVMFSPNGKQPVQQKPTSSWWRDTMQKNKDKYMNWVKSEHERKDLLKTQEQERQDLLKEQAVHEKLMAEEVQLQFPTLNPEERLQNLVLEEAHRNQQVKYQEEEEEKERLLRRKLQADREVKWQRQQEKVENMLADEEWEENIEQKPVAIPQSQQPTPLQLALIDAEDAQELVKDQKLRLLYDKHRWKENQYMDAYQDHMDRIANGNPDLNDMDEATYQQEFQEHMKKEEHFQKNYDSHRNRMENLERKTF